MHHILAGFVKEFFQDMSNPISFALNLFAKRNEYRIEISKLDNERIKIELYYKYHTDRLVYAFELMTEQLAQQRMIIEKSYAHSERVRDQVDRIVAIIEDVNFDKIPNCEDDEHRAQLFTFANGMVTSLDAFNRIQEGHSRLIEYSLASIKVLGDNDKIQLN